MCIPYKFTVPVRCLVLLSVFLALPLTCAMADTDRSFSVDTMQAASGGMLESALAGSAIGVLFGHPYTGFGLVDMGIAAICIFLMFKAILYFGLSNRSDTSPKKNSQYTPDPDDPKKAIKAQAASAWERLRSIDNSGGTGEEAHVLPKSGNAPDDFDREDFLDGAKLLFTRLQLAWAARDLGQLNDFITKDMLDVLTEYAEQNPEKTSVEVLLVTPVFIDAHNDNGETRAKVLFTALIHEEGSEQPVEVKEIWHFVYDTAQQTTWQLDGIEPVTRNE